MSGTIVETAPAKVNLLLHVGRVRPDGLHELCSLFASVEPRDEVRVRVRDDDGPGDRITCPGVEPPNLCARALDAFRAATGGALPPLEVEVEKRIPVAAGLGGGSADAAAALRAANEIAGRPLAADGLREVAARVGADVPSQVEAGHALVSGAGEVVEPLGLPPMALVLVPRADGLSTADVYAEADRLGSPRAKLDAHAVRELARLPLEQLAGRLENDLEPAALALAPAVAGTLEALRASGALAALVSGSGPTAFGVFPPDGEVAEAAAVELGASREERGEEAPLIAQVGADPPVWDRLRPVRGGDARQSRRARDVPARAGRDAPHLPWS